MLSSRAVRNQASRWMWSVEAQFAKSCSWPQLEAPRDLSAWGLQGTRPLLASSYCSGLNPSPPLSQLLPSCAWRRKDYKQRPPHLRPPPHSSLEPQKYQGCWHCRPGDPYHESRHWPERWPTRFREGHSNRGVGGFCLVLECWLIYFYP